MSLHDASRLAKVAPDKIGGYDSKCRRRNCLALKLTSMGLRSVIVLRALFLAAVLFLGNAPRLLAQERHIATYSGVSGTLGPQWVSVDRRLFEQYGLKVEWVLMSGAVRGIQALISGSTNYYTGDPVAAISVFCKAETSCVSAHAQPDTGQPRRAQGDSRARGLARKKNWRCHFRRRHPTSSDSRFEEMENGA